MVHVLLRRLLGSLVLVAGRVLSRTLGEPFACKAATSGTISGRGWVSSLVPACGRGFPQGTRADGSTLRS